MTALQGGPEKGRETEKKQEERLNLDVTIMRMLRVAYGHLHGI